MMKLFAEQDVSCSASERHYEWKEFTGTQETVSVKLRNVQLPKLFHNQREENKKNIC